jgi:osmotically-inducible protein OsmY
MEPDVMSTYESSRGRLTPNRLIAVLAVCGASACQKAGTAAKTVEPSNATPAANGVGQLSAAITADSDVRAAVGSELRKDKKLDQAGINIAVESGIVELTGKVDNLLSKARSSRIAESVRGVRSVSNRLEISAPERPDRDMQRDVAMALVYNAATAKMPIHVDVENAVATLTGTVESWQERQLAERIADGVRGVRLTQNDLVTKYKVKRTDEAIASDVKSRLQWDALVEHDPVEAKVTDSRVTLSGTVGSAAEKSRAITDGWVDGVDSVDSSGIVVKWWDQPDKNLRPFVVKSDTDIAAAIKQATFYDPRVFSFNINPSVKNGVATLTGTVPTLNAKMAAEALARNTVGVTAVNDQLVARSELPAADLYLQARVREALNVDPLLESLEIFLTVEDGHVKFTGSVGTFFESAEASDVASRLSGVKSVDNQLAVREPATPYVYSAYLDPYTPYVETWYVIGARPFGTDADITNRIKTGFLWSPFVHSGDVHVSVENGKATLTGTVQSFRERQAAGNKALEAGAVSVDNELHVG